MRNKWTLVAFLCALFVIYTVDRALLGILAVPIQRETGLDNVSYGIISAAVFWTYSLCVPFSGLAGDRFDRLKIVGLAVVAWSAMAFVAGFSTGFWSLFVFVSIAVCAPQTLYGPSANALIAECHDKTRTMALSCHQAAYYTGWFVSGAAVALVMACATRLSLPGSAWRWPFFAFGATGVALGVAFLRWGRKVRASKPPAAAQAKATLKDSLRAFFCCKTALLVAVCYVTQVFVGYGYSTWGPKFVAQKFGLSPSAAATGVMLYHYLAAFAAILAAGALTDRLVRRFPRFRLVLSTLAVLVTLPALALFGLSDSLAVVWAAAATLGAMLGVIGANQFAAIFDVVPSHFRSGSIGFLNVIGGLVGSLSPVALGALSQRFGTRGFGLGFAAMAAVEIPAAVSLFAACVLTFKADRKEIAS